MKRNLLATKLISFLLVLVMVFSLIPSNISFAEGISEEKPELTSGNSLIVCKDILLDNGAKRVAMFALGKSMV